MKRTDSPWGKFFSFSVDPISEGAKLIWKEMPFLKLYLVPSRCFDHLNIFPRKITDLNYLSGSEKGWGQLLMKTYSAKNSFTSERIRKLILYF